MTTTSRNSCGRTKNEGVSAWNQCAFTPSTRLASIHDAGAVLFRDIRGVRRVARSRDRGRNRRPARRDRDTPGTAWTPIGAPGRLSDGSVEAPRRPRKTPKRCRRDTGRHAVDRTQELMGFGSRTKVSAGSDGTREQLTEMLQSLDTKMETTK